MLVFAGGVIYQPLLAGDQLQSCKPTFQTIVEAEATARLLAILLDSGRNVINENQHLFDNPSKGDMGFTPEVFEEQLIGIFWQRSGIDLHELDSERIPDQAKNLLHQLVEISKQVVAKAQPEINRKGVGFKGFIPAVFGAQVAGRFSAATGVLLGQRALAPRNPSNLPDPFERAALLTFADPSYPREKVISEVTAENHLLRLMLPLYTTRGCLDCHGEPKGELDKTGYPREGLRLGQNAGGISIVITVQE
jgi:general secretion pathway protein A